MDDPSMTRYDSVGEAPEELWQRAAQDGFFRGTKWLAMLEANGFGRRRRYSTVTGGSHCGALATYLLDGQSHHRFQPAGLLTGDDTVLRWLDALPDGERDEARQAVQRLAAAPLVPAAVSVSPFAYQSALVADEPELMPVLLRELADTAAEWDCATSAVLYVDWRNRVLRDALTDAGYVGWIAGANAELSIEWSTMDGYLDAQSCDRRRKIRREMARFDQSGITVRRTPLPEDTTALARLAAVLQDKHGQGYHPEFEDMVLQNYRRFLGSHCTVVGGYRDGVPVGYEIILADGDTWRAGLCGWDDALSQPGEYAYFNVGYYRLIELAIAEGVRTIDYGLEAYEAKLNRGCRLQPLWCYAKVPQPWRPLLAEVADAHCRGMRAVLGQSSAEDGTASPVGVAR